MAEIKNTNHTLILDSRKTLTLSGVKDILSYDEECVRLDTNMGALIIKGVQLHVNRLNLESGEVEVEGAISLMQYIESKQDKSLLQRLFN